MLALTRTLKESVVVLRDPAGNLIGRVQLIDLPKGRKAVLGFDFPRSVVIAREEVDDGKDAEK